MFDVGFAELALLAVLGLLVLGPERLPAVARMIGGYLRKARRTWNTVRAEIEAELAADEIRKQVQEPLDEFDDLRRAATEATSGATTTQESPSPDEAAQADPQAEAESPAESDRTTGSS